MSTRALEYLMERPVGMPAYMSEALKIQLNHNRHILSKAEYVPTPDRISTVKMEYIRDNEGIDLTGYVLENKVGKAYIIHRGKVRILPRSGMQKLMNPEPFSTEGIKR